jgi:phosphoribosylamine---glycine ligase
MSRLRVLVVGSGGREHALGWALARSTSVARVDAAPGNPGLARLGRTWAVRADDLEGQVGLASREGFDLVVVGPEDPLALGLADRLRASGQTVFGPGAAGARLESSKAFAKEFMRRHGIPTASYWLARSMAEADAALTRMGAPVVVKASGLAAGKGVVVAESLEEARAACHACLDAHAFGEAGSIVVLEKKLDGEEVSVLAITDGTTVHVLPSAQDHKRALEGDRGPNTGGMGAYSPAPALTDRLAADVRATIIEPTLSGLAAEGIAFRGLLYFGLMITSLGPQVLEYNVRFGDPETQAILPRFPRLDFGRLLYETARGELRPSPAPVPEMAAGACVVAAARDYPVSGSKGEVISGIEAAESSGAIVFHAGTSKEDGRLVTAGGRILDVVGTGATLPQAVQGAYAGLERIHFEGMRYRRDIAHRAFQRERAGGSR